MANYNPDTYSIRHFWYIDMQLILDDLSILREKAYGNVSPIVDSTDTEGAVTVGGGTVVRMQWWADSGSLELKIRSPDNTKWWKIINLSTAMVDPSNRPEIFLSDLQRKGTIVEDQHIYPDAVAANYMLVSDPINKTYPIQKLPDPGWIRTDNLEVLGLLKAKDLECETLLVTISADIQKLDVRTTIDAIGAITGASLFVTGSVFGNSLLVTTSIVGDSLNIANTIRGGSSDIAGISTTNRVIVESTGTGVGNYCATFAGEINPAKCTIGTPYEARIAALESGSGGSPHFDYEMNFGPYDRLTNIADHIQQCAGHDLTDPASRVPRSYFLVSLPVGSYSFAGQAIFGNPENTALRGGTWALEVTTSYGNPGVLTHQRTFLYSSTGFGYDDSGPEGIYLSRGDRTWSSTGILDITVEGTPCWIWVRAKKTTSTLWAVLLSYNIEIYKA